MVLLGSTVPMVIAERAARAGRMRRLRRALAVTTLLGVGGAVLATYGGQALELYPPGQTARFVGAVIGAIVLLAIVGLIQRRRG